MRRSIHWLLSVAGGVQWPLASQPPLLLPHIMRGLCQATPPHLWMPPGRPSVLSISAVSRASRRSVCAASCEMSLRRVTMNDRALLMLRMDGERRREGEEGEEACVGGVPTPG